VFEVDAEKGRTRENKAEKAHSKAKKQFFISFLISLARFLFWRLFS